MYGKSTKVLFLLVPMLLASFGLAAQGWERAYGAEAGDGLSDVLPTADGGYIAVGHQQDTNSVDIDLLLLKVDADGQEEWSKLIGNSMYLELGKSIQATSDGGYILGGTTSTDNISFGYLVKTDALGNVQWSTNSSRDSIEGRQAIELSDGGFALVGSEILPPSSTQPDSPNKEMMLMKVDAAGLEKWIKNYGDEAFDEGYAVAETAYGFLLAGVTNSYGAGHYDVYVVGADFSGDELWMETHGTANAELGFAMAKCTDGNYVIAGQSEALTPESEDAYLLKITPLGQEMWSKSFPKPGLEEARHIVETSNGGFILTGNIRIDPLSDRNVFLLKTTSNGTEHWTKTFGGMYGDGGLAVREAPNNGYVIAGFTSSFGSGGRDGYLLRTDFSGISNSCFIVGNVHSNLNNSCVPSNFGQNIPDYIVEVAGAVTYFGTTDENGDYHVPVAPGSYNVRLINPSPYWELCQDSVDVTLAGSFDTSTVNFSMHTGVGCPLMEVDLTTLGLRRCFPGSYSVNYRNLGTVVANPGLVEVTFDEYLLIDSASIPWVSQLGNTYTFDVGNVWPFEGGDFQVFFTLDCDSTVLGQTHCSEALIFPDTFCLAGNGDWDGSSIELEATCEEDSIQFRIVNVGDGDMDELREFIIIEDHIVQLNGGGEFQLLSGQDTLVAVSATGSTFRMEADQSPGHPGNSKPCVAVEGCGGMSPGFIIQYPLNDADLAVDADCRENTGSFDPNDKQGFPMGYGPEHYIERGTDIEYLIRFQNTGTDTAFTVVIRDTLSPFLDPTSIQPGASSHDYRFELYGTGVLKFNFDEIMLPDSNVNEPASHGFVKFRIQQQPDLDTGIVIKNSAGIYFDFNEPIITNTTFHKIGENYIVIDQGGVNATTNLVNQPKVLVYPNPFDEIAMFELENVQGNGFRFSLFDATGQLVREEVFREKNFQFDRGNLTAGIYFFQIESDALRIASGKVVLR